MSIAVAGSYLRTLRDRQELTRTDVMIQLIERFPQFRSTDSKVIWAIEEDERKVRSPLLAALVLVLNGNPNDVFDLLTDDALTKADATARAEQWLAREDAVDLDHIAERSTNSRLRAIAQMLKKMENDPEKLTRIAGYLEGLIDRD